MGSSFKLEWGPAICMVLIELFTTGQMLLTKVVVDAGLFVFALLTYRFFLGAALVVPLALIFEPSQIKNDKHFTSTIGALEAEPTLQSPVALLSSSRSSCSESCKRHTCMGGSTNLKEWWPAIFMVLVQFFTTGQVLLTKVVADGGSLAWTLLAYRFFLGTILAIPFAMFFEKGKLKELNLKAFIWIFTSALVGFTIPGLYYIGLGDTSPGYAINFYNIIPIATFILAVLFRKEPLDMRSLVGNIKVAGTLVCVGGTLVISLYKGKVLHLWPTNIIGYHPKQAGAAFGHHHVRGTVLLITSCLSLAVWYTVQAQMLKVFPYKYWSTVATCFVGSIQMAVVGVAMNREKETWELKWNMSLLTIVYSAILNTAAKFVMISWVVTQRGPTYPAMFCAVSVFFTTILDSLLLGHDLSVGSILGMFMILAGLYLFLWGKRKDSVPTSEQTPKEQMLFHNGDKSDKSVANV